MKKSNVEKILIAEITKPQGVKGEVRVRVFCSPLENFFSYKNFFDERMRKYEVSSLRHLKGDFFVVKFFGFDSRSQVESLAGTQLFVLRSALAPPLENEFYVADLVGLSVYEQQKHVGEIVHVANFGAGDLLEILPVNSTETFYLAFNETNVPLVDIDSQKVVICRPKEI